MCERRRPLPSAAAPAGVFERVWLARQMQTQQVRGPLEPRGSALLRSCRRPRRRLASCVNGRAFCAAFTPSPRPRSTASPSRASRTCTTRTGKSPPASTRRSRAAARARCCGQPGHTRRRRRGGADRKQQRAQQQPAAAAGNSFSRLRGGVKKTLASLLAAATITFLLRALPAARPSLAPSSLRRRTRSRLAGAACPRRAGARFRLAPDT